MNNIFEILENLIINENTVKIDRELERSDYLMINDILNRIGGKWNPKKKAHIFDYNPSEVINDIIKNKVLPKKEDDNPLDFYQSSNNIVDFIMQEIEVCDAPLNDLKILEPSAGMGVFVKALHERFNNGNFPDFFIDAVELDNFRFKYLESLSLDNVNLYHQSFIDFKPDYKYNLIVMNPPFNLIGDSKAYVTHIYHAWSLLRDNGILFAITPQNWKNSSTRRLVEFENFIYTNGVYYNFSSGEFKESGTMVATNCIVLKKKNWQDIYNKKFNGYKNEWFWEIELSCETDRIYYNKIIEESKVAMDTSTMQYSIYQKGSLPKSVKNWLEDYFKKLITDLREDGLHIYFDWSKDFDILCNDFLAKVIENIA